MYIDSFGGSNKIKLLLVGTIYIKPKVIISYEASEISSMVPAKLSMDEVKLKTPKSLRLAKPLLNLCKHF